MNEKKVHPQRNQDQGRNETKEEAKEAKTHKLQTLSKSPHLTSSHPYIKEEKENSSKEKQPYSPTNS